VAEIQVSSAPCVHAVPLPACQSFPPELLQLSPHCRVLCAGTGIQVLSLAQALVLLLRNKAGHGKYSSQISKLLLIGKKVPGFELKASLDLPGGLLAFSHHCHLLITTILQIQTRHHSKRKSAQQVNGKLRGNDLLPSWKTKTFSQRLSLKEKA